MLAIVQDLQARQARLLRQVQQLPATSVAGICAIEGAIDEQRSLARQITGFIQETRLDRPEPSRHLVRPAAFAAPLPARPAALNYRDQFGSALTELQAAMQAAPGDRASGSDNSAAAFGSGAAFGRSDAILAMPSFMRPAGAVRPANAYAGQQPAAPQARHAHGSYGGAWQHPVQVVYLPAHQAPSARPAHPDHDLRRDDDEDAPRRGRRAPAQGRSDDDAPDGIVSKMLRGLGTVSVMIWAAVIISSMSFADRIFSRSPSPPAAQEHIEDRRGSAREGASRTGASSEAIETGEKTYTARLERPARRGDAEPPRVTPLAQQASIADSRVAAAVAPIARSKPALRPIDPVEVEVKPQRPVKLIAKAPPEDAVSNAPTFALPKAEIAPAPKKMAMATAAVPPPSAVRPVETPAEAPAAAPESTGGLYVAVLSTHKDAKAAHEEFAELQKQHRAVLGAKQSEVQLTAGATGSWHRLVVTPAAPKEAANEICNKLRSSGYGRCWVKPY